jgi:dolichol kinase
MVDLTETRFETVQEALVEGELGRRLVHASGSGLPALYLLNIASWPEVKLLFVICAIGTLALEIMRLSIGLDWFIYRHLTREYEQDNPAGYMLYMVSSATVAVIFQPQIAIPAVLMLMIGDPISGSISTDQLRRVKRPPILAAMFTICSLIAFPFLYERPFAVILGGLGGMTADGVKPIIRGYIVDDNLTIAPVAAICLWIGSELSILLL